MNNPAAEHQSSDNLTEVQKPLLEIARNLSDSQGDILVRAKKIQEALGALDMKTIPYLIGNKLIAIFKSIPESYFIGTPDMAVFLGFGVSFIKDEKGDYTVHSAPQNKPEQTVSKEDPTPADPEPVVAQPKIDVWRIQDTRDSFEVPHMIAGKIAEETTYSFEHTSAPGNIFTWSEGRLVAAPGDNKSDVVLRGDLLKELRDKKVTGSILLSTGERISISE